MLGVWLCGWCLVLRYGDGTVGGGGNRDLGFLTLAYHPIKNSVFRRELYNSMRYLSSPTKP